MGYHLDSDLIGYYVSDLNTDVFWAVLVSEVMNYFSGSTFEYETRINENTRPNQPFFTVRAIDLDDKVNVR